MAAIQAWLGHRSITSAALTPIITLDHDHHGSSKNTLVGMDGAFTGLGDLVGKNLWERRPFR
jgi:hypothetical protein